MGISFKPKAFTLVEMVAVLAIIAATMGIALGGFRFFSNDLKYATQKLTKRIQTTYHKSIQDGKIYRMSFQPEESKFRIEVIELEEKIPPKEDDEAYQAWEDKQVEKERQLNELSADERRELNRLDRSSFKLVREDEIGRNVRLTKLLKAGQPNQSFLEEDKIQIQNDEAFLIFYPTGETEAAMLVVSDLGGETYSLVLNPLTGRVIMRKGELTEADWQKLYTD